MKTYHIHQFPDPPLAVDIESDPPPCLICDAPVVAPSMSGPLICPDCDMGRNKDGTKVTMSQLLARAARVREKIAAWRRASVAGAASSSPPIMPSIENATQAAADARDPE